MGRSYSKEVTFQVLSPTSLAKETRKGVYYLPALLLLDKKSGTDFEMSRTVRNIQSLRYSVPLFSGLPQT